MLGLGDTHGVDAIRWMLDYADRSFTLQTPTGPVSVETFSDPKVVYFPDESAPRTTYRFDFADQHVIPSTLDTDGSFDAIMLRLAPDDQGSSPCSNGQA